MNRKWAREVAKRCIEAIDRGDRESLWNNLNPVLDAKVPFPLLDEIGRLLGEAGMLNPSRYFEVFEEIIATDKMGGYVIVGQGLAVLCKIELEESIHRAEEIIARAQKWYVCDIIGERVLGQCLVNRFETTIAILDEMTSVEDQWVRRSIGVAVHFFAKRRPEDLERLKRLLSLLSRLIGDKRVNVVKGVGWGLKTIGKHQPKLVEEYLQETMKTKKISRLMLRKATTYLEERTKEKLFKCWQHNLQRK